MVLGVFGWGIEGGGGVFCICFVGGGGGCVGGGVE